jgi:hypothetical protein
MREAGEVSAPLQRFEILYKACHRAIYAYVWRRMAECRDDVPDIVAEVLPWHGVGWTPCHIRPAIACGYTGSRAG